VSRLLLFLTRERPPETSITKVDRAGHQDNGPDKLTSFSLAILQCAQPIGGFLHPVQNNLRLFFRHFTSTFRVLWYLASAILEARKVCIFAILGITCAANPPASGFGEQASGRRKFEFGYRAVALTLTHYGPVLARPSHTSP
jgi:hypothetical protein